MPRLRTDAEAEKFVAEADLSQYDLSDFKSVHFEIAPKETAISLRLPKPLLEAVKAKANAKGVPYTRYVRMLIETDVTRRRGTGTNR